jgi:hypothetical protein
MLEARQRLEALVIPKRQALTRVQGLFAPLLHGAKSAFLSRLGISTKKTTDRRWLVLAFLGCLIRLQFEQKLRQFGLLLQQALFAHFPRPYLNLRHR